MRDEVILVPFHDPPECSTELFLGEDARQGVGSAELLARQRLYQLGA